MLSKLIGFGREKFIMLSLIFLLNFCSGYSKITPAGERDNDSTKITIKNEQKRYAILFEPVDNSKGFYLKDKDGNVLWDEGDKNASLIHLARMYDSLLKLGFEKKNIYVMFNGSIDTKERRDREKIKVLGALKGIKATSLEELAQSFDKVKCRFKKGDVLLFYLGGRGVPPPIKPDLIKRGDNGKYIPSSRVESDVEDDFHYFEIEIGAGRHETLPVSKLEYILKKITNHKKEMKFICIFDFCYSGGFGKEIGNQNKEIAILTSSTDSSEIVLSRTYSFRSLVLSAMHNKKADSSKDDMITIGEAFNYAERKRAPYLEKHIKDIIHPPCWPEHRNRHTGRAYNLNTADFGIYKIR